MSKPKLDYIEVFKQIRKHGIAHEEVYSVLALAAVDWIEEQGIDLANKLVLDMGCGSGTYSHVLAERKANVIAFDVYLHDLRKAKCYTNNVLATDAMQLGIADNSVDFIFSSNMLEHVIRPFEVITESYRVLKPGGGLYLSWCNWLSPFGGHEFMPFHFISQLLGPDVGLRAYQIVRRQELCVQIAYKTFWPTYIGKTISFIKKKTNFNLIIITPRYWPSLGFICAIPIIREFLTWNCQMLLIKPSDFKTSYNKNLGV